MIQPVRSSLRFGALALVALVLVASASAASSPVTYSYYTATGSSDTSWAIVDGYDSIVAGNAGGDSTSFGGVTWLPMLSDSVYCTANGVSLYYSARGVAWAATSDGFYTGGPDLLNYGGYSLGLQGSGVDYTIELTDLTIGKNYKIQFVMADTRDDNGYATIFAKGAYVTGNSERTLSSYTNGQFAVITATFTATGTSAQFQPGQDWNAGASNATFVSGIQVLAAPQTVTTTPSFSPPGGGYASAQSVTLTSDIGSTIYYTTDGSDPTTSETRISGGSPIGGIEVPIDTTETIKAYATLAGLADSAVASATYHTYTLIPTNIWTNPDGGNWDTAGNWQENNVPNGSGVTADFSMLTLTANAAVTLDLPTTVGKLKFGLKFTC